jgi:Flp pilus assembly protein TadG
MIAMPDKNINKKTEARKKGQRGAALLESALVFSSAICMILFIVDMGRVLLTQQFISERARVAVRSAVVNNWTSDQVKNYVAYGSTSAPGGETSTPGYLGLLPSEVTFNTVADSGIGDARYQVIITGVPLFTWIPYMAGKYNAPTVTATAPVQSQGSTS